MNDNRSAFHAIGGVLLYLGVGLLGLALADGVQALPFHMPRTWHLHRPLWVGLSIALLAAGWKLQREPDRVRNAASLPAPGRSRFQRVVVYSREGCHLCDDAKAVLAEYAEYLPGIEEVDIETDPELVSKFGEQIPVVEIDGKVRFRGRVDELLLRRLIEGANADVLEVE